MAKKNNIRSMRFSDEIIEMIESQTGSNFSEKFENLVTRCMWELPAKEKQLKVLDRKIEEQGQRLLELRKKVSELDNFIVFDMSDSLCNLNNRLVEFYNKLDL